MEPLTRAKLGDWIDIRVTNSMRSSVIRIRQSVIRESSSTILVRNECRIRGRVLVTSTEFDRNLAMDANVYLLLGPCINAYQKRHAGFEVIVAAKRELRCRRVSWAFETEDAIYFAESWEHPDIPLFGYARVEGDVQFGFKTIEVVAYGAA